MNTTSGTSRAGAAPTTVLSTIDAPASSAPPQTTTSASGFAAMQAVTASCHGVLNTTFTQLTPKPSWYDGLSQELAAAQAVANDWVDNLAPAMTAAIPQHLIDYGTTYAALTAEITKLADADPTASGSDNPTVKAITALIQQLQDGITDIVSSVDSMSSKLTAWGDQLQAAHNALQNGSASIQAAETALSSDIDAMNNAIANLHTLIDEENKGIAASGIAIGVGLLALVAGIALAPETGGASLVVAAGGVLAIAGGATAWGVLQSKINDQFAQISKDQAEIADDKRQIVALSGLSLSSQTAVSSLGNAALALSDVKTMWTSFGDDLDGVLAKLATAETGVMAIVQSTDVLAAQDEWSIAVNFAQQLVGMSVPVDAQTLPMAQS